jgi:hypothetical protein
LETIHITNEAKWCILTTGFTLMIINIVREYTHLNEVRNMGTKSNY